MKSIYKFVQQHGGLEFIRRLWIIATKRFFQIRTVFIFKPRNDVEIEPESSLDIKKLSRIDIQKMIEVMYLQEDDINRRYDNGDRCYAVMEGEKIATYVWVQFKIHWMEELFLKFKLTPKQVWLYNGVTIKSARCKGYYKNILRYMDKVLRAENFTEVYGYAEERNLPSIRGLEKAGYVRVVLIRMKKILSKIEYKVTVFDENAWYQLEKTIMNKEDSKWIIESGLQ